LEVEAQIEVIPNNPEKPNASTCAAVKSRRANIPRDNIASLTTRSATTKPARRTTLSARSPSVRAMVALGRIRTPTF
jgi:hypothetical protein